MSRGYKVYNRKLHAVSQTSIQFDKLFHENSNRPTASKSAGTIGKWGVISCTSLRSTNLKGRRDEPLGSKRKSRELSSKTAKHAAEDPFSFDTESAAGRRLVGSAAAVPPVSKPKKFFKSRNSDTASPSEAVLSESIYQGNNRGGGSSESSYGTKKFKESVTMEQPPSASKKFFTTKKSSGSVSGEQTEAMNLSSPTKTTNPPENKPPIVLRIIKGTSHLVNETDDKAKYSYHISKQPTSNENSVVTRITRNSTRSARNNEINYESQYCSPYETRKRHSTSTSPNSSITEAPRKVKTLKISIGPPTSSFDEMLHTAESNTSCPTTESSVAVPEAGNEVTDEEVPEPSTSSEDVPEDVLPTSKNESIEHPVVTENENFVSTEESEQIKEHSNLQFSESTNQPTYVVPPNDSVGGDNENELVTRKEDEEKLARAEELLQSTCTDFAAATEKLLSVPQLAVSKSEKDHDWFSDSEDSSGMIDQMNSGTSVGEMDASKPEADAALESEQPMERTSSPATKKKGSIFKSRSLITDGSKKRLALYKHKWSDNDKLGSGGGNLSQPGASQPGSSSTAYTDMEEEFVSEKLTRVTSWPATDKDSHDLAEMEAVTSVKCTKKAKGFYTVVRNVQKAHQIQESGEFQEFNDDVEYILDALQDTFPIGTRCLSAITLATKCMVPAFRMHVRAHGTVAKFFRALHDATKDQSLGLCTATVMFVLSQDRLNMDLDKHSLELMLNLLESDVSHRHALDDCGMTDTQLHKNKQRVRELCAEIQSQGHAKHLNLDNITVGHLAMETLLSLTSRRAGEWFKEELRELGGLEHIVKTICECCRQVGDYVVEWTDILLEKLRKVDRCLRVLENVTFQNEENQLYLIKYGNGILLDTLVQLFRQCDSEIPLYPVTDPGDKESTGTVIREVLLATLKVLINLTHDYNNQSYGSLLTGERKGIIDAALHLLLQVPNYVPDEKKFDLLVLALILLINLVEHCQSNRSLLFEAKAPPDPETIFQSNSKSAVQALVALFYQQEELARSEELKTDAILDGKKDSEQQEVVPEKPKSHEEFIEDTVAKLLQKAGRNMEHTLISAYVGLLLGYLIMDNPGFEKYVRQCFPEQNFKTMVAVLQKVYNFMNLTASAVGSSRGIAQTERVINYLTKSDSLVETPFVAEPTLTNEDNFS